MGGGGEGLGMTGSHTRGSWNSNHGTELLEVLAGQGTKQHLSPGIWGPGISQADPFNILPH